MIHRKEQNAKPVRSLLQSSSPEHVREAGAHPEWCDKSLTENQILTVTLVIVALQNYNINQNDLSIKMFICWEFELFRCSDLASQVNTNKSRPVTHLTPKMIFRKLFQRSVSNQTP